MKEGYILCMENHWDLYFQLFYTGPVTNGSLCVRFPQVSVTVQMCLWTRWKPWPLWWPTNVLLLVSIKVLAFHKVYRRSSLNSAHILILYRRLVLMWKCQRIISQFSFFPASILYVFMGICKVMYACSCGYKAVLLSSRCAIWGSQSWSQDQS